MDRRSGFFARFPVAAAAAFLALGGAAWAGPLDRPIPVTLWGLSFSHETVVMTFFVAVVVLLFCWWLSRGLSEESPSRGQMLLELIVGFFDDLVRQSIGPNRGRRYLPWIGTLFLFLWFCNMFGMIPLDRWYIGGEPWNDFNRNEVYDPGETFSDVNGDGVHEPGFPVPGFVEPTTNLNVPLGLALLFVVLIGHGSHIRIHGLGGYVKDYFSPGGLIGVVMFPLNLVGKLAEIVSVSFRLFGNIFGGAVIIAVVGGLLHYVLLPIGLYGFFGVFVGTIQAFVFTMLALTYISSGAAEE